MPQVHSRGAIELFGAAGRSTPAPSSSVAYTRESLDRLCCDQLGYLEKTFFADVLRIWADMDPDGFRHVLRAHHCVGEGVKLLRADNDRRQATLDQLCGAVDTPRRACSSVRHSYNGGIRLPDDLVQ